VEPQVGHFVHYFRAVAAVVGVLGGHHDFGGLLADLLEEGVGALVQQARDVAFLGVAAARGQAAFDDRGQAGERVGGAVVVHCGRHL